MKLVRRHVYLKRMIKKEQINSKKKREIAAYVVIVVLSMVAFLFIIPLFLPSNARVLTTENGTRITTFGSKQCAVERSDGSAAMYIAGAENDIFVMSEALRGDMPNEISFNGKSLDEDKVSSSVKMMHQMKLDDCFKPFSQLIGVSKDAAKEKLQKYGTVFETSQETHPDIMKNGVRFGLDLMDAENNTAVLAFADENNVIDAVQFTVHSEKSKEIVDKFLRINNIELGQKKASEFKFSESNSFFNNTKEFIDVFYLKDGTLTIKYDITLGNYVIFELRTYGSMNQGFHGAFKTDKEVSFVNESPADTQPESNASNADTDEAADGN